MPKLATKNRTKIKENAQAVKSIKVKPKRSSSQGTSRQQLSAAQLFERAQQAIAFERYQVALQLMKDALHLEPENLEIIDARGALLAELGQEQEAVQVLQHAVELSPDHGYEKYMYLGQLLQGEHALAATQKGVEVLQQDVSKLQDRGAAGSSAHKQLSQQLAAALCSLAEMRMALAEDISEVSSDADALLQQARAVDPGSPEPLQALASLRYELGSAEEALQLLRESMALWFEPQPGSGEEADSDDAEDVESMSGAAEDELRIPKKPVTMSETGEQEDAEASSGSDSEWTDGGDRDHRLPSYEFRFECAKLLLELDDTTDKAIQVLEDLIAENDSVLDVWHVLALSYYSGAMLDEAVEVCKTGMQLMQQQQVDPDEKIALAFVDLQSAIAEARTAEQS